jgi:hypothetical protein
MYTTEYFVRTICTMFNIGSIAFRMGYDHPDRTSVDLRAAVSRIIFTSGIRHSFRRPQLPAERCRPRWPHLLLELALDRPRVVGTADGFRYRRRLKP